ncbi:MAG: DUF2802 domain-containing protein [Steroidobacteraceae bacterium]
MFETLPNPSLEMVLIAGRALLLLGAFWIFALAFIRWRRSDDLANRALHASIERTFAEVRSLHESISVMNARIEALSERAELDSRMAPSSTGNSQRGYDIATRLARNGADVNEIVANCGITRHEAELLLRLHGTHKQAPQQQSRMPAESARAPVPRQPERSQIEEEREMLTRAPAPQMGRKRGSLLSVVG